MVRARLDRAMREADIAAPQAETMSQPIMDPAHQDRVMQGRAIVDLQAAPTLSHHEKDHVLLDPATPVLAIAKFDHNKNSEKGLLQKAY